MWILSWRYWPVETEGKTQNVSFGISVNVILYVYVLKIVPVHCMESYVEYGVIAAHFLIFGSRWRRMCSSTPHFTPVKNPGTHWIEVWVTPWLICMILEKRETFAPSSFPNADNITRGLVTTPTTLSWFLCGYLMALSNTCLWGTFERQLKSTIKIRRVRIKQFGYHRANFYR